ncbi:transcriptional regulator [Pseudomonas sp. OV226]|jgi:DNA-binding winged helix-turn-helix (wHTH) protein|uniref:transcriptional regulator n=1 Tax=Pseudomonas sp. OV226 TaxID=2135588 RepID=UPI000D6AF826|nr:winged helix-turn-helix domain-containing protein [Pseudomonas sp. OV226]PWK39638.1 DNA-binding winged helix-turn-helix (wHTH) protein [Pseudomonas sp. OV226]
MGQLLIDEHLVFDENNFLLFRVDAANEEPLRLGAIASRCLAMLLRSGGSVVRKRELMAGAWGQYGLEVTDNSLAQVVRQLRLALEKLQPDREFIQTLPRIGYKLADGVTVEELTAHPKPALPSCTMVTGNEAPLPLEPAVSAIADTEGEAGEPPSIKPIPASTDPAPGPIPTSAIATPRRWHLWLALPVWGACAFVLGRIWLAPPLEVEPPAFAAPVTMDDVLVHLPTQDVQPPVAPHLQLMVENSRKLAGILGLSTQNMHLYLLPSRRGADQILCDGALETASSRCIGVQQHD